MIKLNTTLNYEFLPHNFLFLWCNYILMFSSLDNKLQYDDEYNFNGYTLNDTYNKMSFTKS